MSFKIGSPLNFPSDNQLSNTAANSTPIAQRQIPERYAGGTLSVTVKDGDTQEKFVYRALYQHAIKAGLGKTEAKEFAGSWTNKNTTFNHRADGNSTPHTAKEFQDLKAKGKAAFDLTKEYDAAILADLNKRVDDNTIVVQANPAYTPEERAAMLQQQIGTGQNQSSITEKPIMTMIDGTTKDGKPIDAKTALTRYIQQTYNPITESGSRRVWGDKIDEMVGQAQSNGVQVNLQVVDGTTLVGINSADKQKLDNLFNQALGESIKGEQASLKGQQEATNQVTDIGRMYANGAINTVNHLTEPVRGTLETLGVKTSAAKLPKLDYQSDYGKKNGVAGEIGTEIGAAIVSAPAILKTVVGKVITGVSGAYNVGAGAAGLDPTEPGETTRYREMSTLEQGLRIVGGAAEVFGARPTFSNAGKTGTALSQTDEVIEALTPDGQMARVQVPRSAQTATEAATAKPVQTAEELVSEMAAKSNNGGRTIIGRRAQAAEINDVTEELAAKGINVVKNADKQIDKVNKNAAAAFDYEKGELLLRKDATFLETFHEKTHALQWAKVGKDNYLKLGRLVREEHVYKTIVDNKHLFSQREINEAQRVIQNYRIQKSRGEID